MVLGLVIMMITVSWIEGDRDVDHCGLHDIMLMCIENHCGVGVVPIMALLPSQGVQRDR